MLSQARTFPFNIAVEPSQGTIVLSGFVSAKAADWDEVADKLRVVKPGHWTIDSEALTLVPDGVSLWIAAVHDYLPQCQLTYRTSQLAMVLEYDDRYRHRHTTFDDHYAAAPSAAVSEPTAVAAHM
jgi:hypothetical protein